MAEPLTGIIRGRTIELSGDSGIVDGESVEVVVRAIKRSEVWGDGLRRSAGAMAEHWTEEDDRILEAIYKERHQEDRTDPIAEFSALV